MKNRLWCTFLLVLLVFLMLLGLFYLPHTDIYGKDLRRVNIMSDIQHRDESGNIIAEAVGGISKDQTKQQGSPENDPDKPGNVLKFTFVLPFLEAGIADTAQKQ